jgi:ribosomal protein S18 acetylase RimI-like enzyme
MSTKPNQQINIRKATPKDWKIIQKLNHQAMTANFQYDDHHKPDWEFAEKGEKFFKKIVDDQKQFCLIAMLDKKPVGYLNGYQKIQGHRNIKIAEIENVAVIPPHQSQGIGSQLITKFKKWCQQKNITHLYVSVYFTNKRAVNLYNKLGLKPIDIGLEGRI